MAIRYTCDKCGYADDSAKGWMKVTTESVIDTDQNGYSTVGDFNIYFYCPNCRGTVNFGPDPWFGRFKGYRYEVGLTMEGNPEYWKPMEKFYTYRDAVRYLHVYENTAYPGYKMEFRKLERY